MSLEVVKLLVMKTNEYILLNESEPLLTPAQMAKAMGVSVGYLANLRSEGKKGPAFIRLGDGPRSVIRYYQRQRIA